jgi:hypothetical protein
MEEVSNYNYCTCTGCVLGELKETKMSSDKEADSTKHTSLQCCTDIEIKMQMVTWEEKGDVLLNLNSPMQVYSSYKERIT